MAWNTVITNWANNDLVSASHLNNIGNNLIFLHEPAFVNVYNNTGTMSIPHDDATPISFPDLRTETESSMQGGNLTRLVAPYTGLYLIIGQVMWPANSTGMRYLEITLNVSETSIARVQRSSTSGSYGEAMEVSTLRRLAQDDYVQLQAYQNSGGSLSLVTNAYTPVFMMTYLGKV